MNKHKFVRQALSVAAASTVVACLAQPALAGNDMASIAWLAGVWQTTLTDGAQTEYVYVPETNGVMLSTMFQVKNGQPTRYELRIIKVEGNGVLFRENAFKGDFTPGAPVPERPLQSADAKSANFTDMQVTRVSDNEVKMTLTSHAGGEAKNFDVELHRVLRFVEVKKK